LVNIERLDPKDFPLLKNIGDGFMPDPKRSVAIIAHHDISGIVGRIFIVSPAHVEGVFIEKAWRNTIVFDMLMKRAELEAHKEGLTQILAFAKDDQIAGYVERLKYKKLPFTVWSKQLCP
jgi:hypothetical protein